MLTSIGLAHILRYFSIQGQLSCQASVKNVSHKYCTVVVFSDSLKSL